MVERHHTFRGEACLERWGGGVQEAWEICYASIFQPDIIRRGKRKGYSTQNQSHQRTDT